MRRDYLLISQYFGNFQEHFKCYCSLNSFGIYLFTVTMETPKTICEICSNLTIKTPERRHWHHSIVFIVNFDHIPHIVLVFS